LTEKELNEIVRISLETDRAADDLTSRLVLNNEMHCCAVIIAREKGTISGHDYAEAVFRYLDPDLEYTREVEDGEPVRISQRVARITGKAVPVMAGERAALNFLGHLSGIATLTASFAAELEGTGISVLDTRKTTPGLRKADKKAVRDGGGLNHRMDLAEYILVKENHIAAAGGIGKVMERLGERLPEAEIEVESIDMLRTVLENPPGRVMLDNFSPEDVQQAVREIEKLEGRRPEVEVSGGISLDTIASYALPGVDYISVGQITSSAGTLDLSLILEE
jgi:nicotinate-nucleotide pyrophosphorylase (carboxylating)